MIDSVQKASAPVEKPDSVNQPDPLKEVAKNFEAVFLTQMINSMRQTVQKGGLVPESQAERVYQSMLDQQYAQQMADTEQIGFSHLIHEHLLRASSR